MLSFNELQIFCAVIKYNSFTAAATALHMSQPSVSIHIKSLEDHFGCQLILRNRKGMTLTEAGKSIFSFAQETITKESILKQTITQQLSFNQKITIASNHTFGSYILPKVLSMYQLMHPEHKITLLIGYSNEFLQKIDNGEIDIVIVPNNVPNNHQRRIIIMTERLLIIGSRQYLNSLTFPITSDNLGNQRFILPPSGRPFRKMIDTKLQQCGIQIARPALELDSMEAIKEAVITGAGIAVTFACGAQHDLLAERLIEVVVSGVTLEVSYYAITREQLSPDSLTNKILNYLYWKLCPPDRSKGKSVPGVESRLAGNQDKRSEDCGSNELLIAQY